MIEVPPPGRLNVRRRGGANVIEMPPAAQLAERRAKALTTRGEALPNDEVNA